MEQITKLTVGLGIRLNRVDKMLESKRRTNEKVRIDLTPISHNNFKSLFSLSGFTPEQEVQAEGADL